MAKVTYGISGYKVPTKPYTRHTWPTILNPHHKGRGKMGDGLSHSKIHSNCVVRAELLQAQINRLEDRIAKMEAHLALYTPLR